MKKEIKEFIELYDKIKVEFFLTLKEECDQINEMNTVYFVSMQHHGAAPIVLTEGLDS